MNKGILNTLINYIISLCNLEFNFMKYFNVEKIFTEKSHINESQLSFIAKSLGQIYKDGIPIKKALFLVEETLSDKYYKKSLRGVIEGISEGKSLSESFNECRQLYPKLFIGLIFIGENTGKLYEILIQIGEYYEKSSELKNELKMACVYPIFILFSIAILMILFINNIIPSFYSLYSSMGITPSYSYRIVYNFQDGFKEDYIVNITYILCWITIILIFCKYIISYDKFEYFFRFKIIKDILEYMIILILSIITSSGVSILYGLEYCIGSISPDYLNKKIIEIRNSIVKGNSLSEALEETGVLSNYNLALIKVREETGSIEEGFKILSLRLEKKIHKKIKCYLKALSPFLIIVMGILVFIFISLFVLPLFKDLQDGIR